jgi:hypothetical protein
MNLELLRKTYCNLTYEQFCQKCGFTKSQYAIDKFVVYKRAIEGILSFDSETLANLLGE